MKIRICMPAYWKKLTDCFFSDVIACDSSHHNHVACFLTCMNHVRWYLCMRAHDDTTATHILHERSRGCVLVFQCIHIDELALLQVATVVHL